MLNSEQVEIINKSRRNDICDFWLDSISISSNSEIESELNILSSSYEVSIEKNEIRKQINILVEVLKRK